ncbi:shikimate kinase [Algoriphagus aquatilis]|uniref:Shikimate kinase n=1 Tax=Algoriphagus aquatilis TaxID=490186 RepID=A0ABW0BTM3_9BACT
MKQIIIIGFSTTGKSSLIKKIKEEIPSIRRSILDTDEEISKNYENSISNIYLQLGREKALFEILKLESQLIENLIEKPNNLIIAAGPGLPFRENFKKYISIKQPHVILLENSANNIYENLKKRREELFNKLKEPRSDFGIWDIGVMVDEYNIEFDKKIAIENIENILKQRNKTYRYFAKHTFTTSEVLSNDEIPKEILEIL